MQGQQEKRGCRAFAGGSLVSFPAAFGNDRPYLGTHCIIFGAFTLLSHNRGFATAAARHSMGREEDSGSRAQRPRRDGKAFIQSCRVIPAEAQGGKWPQDFSHKEMGKQRPSHFLGLVAVAEGAWGVLVSAFAQRLQKTSSEQGALEFFKVHVFRLFPSFLSVPYLKKTKDAMAKALRTSRKSFVPPAGGGNIQISKIRSHSARHRCINDLKQSRTSTSTAMRFSRITSS